MAAAGKLGIISKVENTQNREEIEITTHKWCASVRESNAAKKCVFSNIAPTAFFSFSPAVWSVFSQSGQLCKLCKMHKCVKKKKQVNRQKHVKTGKNRSD